MFHQITYKISTLFLLIGLFYITSAQQSDSTPVMPQAQQDSAQVVPFKHFKQQGTASYYARKFNGRRTASGERYHGRKLTAAHRSLPFGTLVRVADAKTGRWLIVRINDRGPHHRKRIIDLSYEAARQLGMTKGAGLMKVKIRVVEWPKGYVAN